MLRKIYSRTTAIALIASATPALAQTTDSDIVVAANRSPQAADRVGQSVTIIDEATIDASQATSVSDLLIQTPGVTLSRAGGIGTATSLRIRGGETDQTLVVIDGVKLNDPSAIGGGFNFGNLLVGDITRIEVLRGAQSTLWGSQAIGGLVSIETATATKPIEASFDAEAGSRRTAYIRAGVGGASDALSWRIGGSRFTTNGFSTFARGTEADGYENGGASGRATLTLTPDLSVDLRAVYSSGRVDFDGFPAPFFEFADTAEYGTTEEFVGYAGVNFALFGGRLRNRVGYGQTETDRRNYDPGQAITTTTFTARGTNRRIEYQGVADLAAGWTATFGVEHERSNYRSTSPSAFDPAPAQEIADVGITGIYAQVQAEVARGVTLTGGVRRDDHETFGERFLGQAAAAWSINDGGTILRASFGQGFKAPSLFQLNSAFGNAALRPEAADTYDIGIEQQLLGRRVTLSAILFGRDTVDQIDFFSCGATPDPLCSVNGVPRFGYYANIARTRARGVELIGAARLGAFRVDANYSWTDATNRAGADRGNRLARRPAHQVNAWVGYIWPVGLTTTAVVRYAGDSFDDTGNSVRLSPYTLVDLRATFAITRTVEAFARIENLFEEEYETVAGYGIARRGGFVGLRAKL